MNSIVRIYGKIDEKNSLDIREDFVKAMKEETDQIVLLITSSGGNVSTITTIWELIKMTDKKIVSVGIEKVCSAAGAIFMMADRRILFPNTEFMIHKAGTYVSGKEDSVQEAAKGVKRATQIAWEPILENSLLTHNILSRKCRDDKDWVLTDEEIQKYGIVTEEYDREEVKKLIM